MDGGKTALGYAVVSEVVASGRRTIVRGRLLSRLEAEDLCRTCEAQYNTAHWEGRPRPTRYTVVELAPVAEH